MLDWIIINREWLFSGIGVAIISGLLGWILKSFNNNHKIRIKPSIRSSIVKKYPDPRLKIKKNGILKNTEYFILFNRGMLSSKNIHNVKVEINHYEDEKGNLSSVMTMHETFGSRKDFTVLDLNDVIFCYGEGGVDWSVWVVKRNKIDRIVTIYGSMVYYGFEKGFVGSASLLLVGIEKSEFYRFKPTYIDSKLFDAKFPLVSKILDKRNSRIVADFHDLADVNFFELKEEIDTAF